MNMMMVLSVDLGGAFSPERLAYAGKMTLLGMLMIFAVLGLLWGVLALFKVFMYDMPQRKAKAKAQKKTEPAPVVANEPTVVTTTASNNDDEVVAVIMAAISAYISADPALAEEYAGGFRVVSFKRVRDKAAWNKK